MKVTLVSIIVQDQARALDFYRDILRFVVKQDIPTGPPGAPHWITLAPAEDPDGARISLEPDYFEFVKDYQRALKSNNVPLTAFEVVDIQAEYDRLTALGVTFRSPPGAPGAGMPATATFDDQCGNWIMLYEAAQS